MNVLLDTHTLIWWLDDDPALNDTAREIIANSQNRVFASTACLWEIGIKHAIGKMPIHPDILRSGIEQSGLILLNISPAHAVHVANLALIEDHRDPFDRMLIAQAIIEDLTMISADKKIREHTSAYGIRLIWAGR